MRQWSLLGTSEERESPEISQGRRGMLVAIQEDQAGELGLRRLHLKYDKKRALKQPMILTDFHNSWVNRWGESLLCHGPADVGRRRRFF